MGTKATSGKLRKAALGLQEFLGSDDIDDTSVDLWERNQLRKAQALIEALESRLWQEEWKEN